MFHIAVLPAERHSVVNNTFKAFFALSKGLFKHNTHLDARNGLWNKQV